MSRCPQCGSKECCGGSMSETIENLEAQLAEARAEILNLRGMVQCESDKVDYAQAENKRLRKALEEINHTSRDFAWQIADEALKGDKDE